MKDKIFLDSNILLYTFDCRDTQKQVIAKKIVLNDVTTISVQVINEVSSNLLRKFSFENNHIEQFVDSCYSRYDVVNIDKNIFLKACKIRSNYSISYYDSLILASAIDARCSVLYSEDMQHNQKIENLTIVNPFK